MSNPVVKDSHHALLRRWAVLAWTMCFVAAGPLIAQTNSRMTKQDVETLVKEVSNWGRWGEKDELGAINLITPAKRKEAAALVVDGDSVSLARDVVFIRTGRWARRDKIGPWAAETEGSAGLHASCARWLRQRDVAMIGSDAASDVLPSGIPGVSHPLHLLVLHAMGVHIFDNCDLEELSTVCAAKKRWEFLLTAAPLAVEGGTGSPLNPIATF